MGYIEEIRQLVGKRPIILVGAVAIIEGSESEILLQQRRYPEGSWGLPGGLLELGESTEEAAIREVYEETGLTLSNLRLHNVFSGSDYFVRAQNGDEFFAVTVAYHTNDFAGKIVTDPIESIQTKFISIHELPENMLPSHKKIIEDYKQSLL